jgi:hypothetical protein
MLTQYTAYDDIRAALGVAEEEIPDIILALPNYEQILTFDLYDLFPTLGPAFLALAAQSTRTANEQRFVDLTQVYCSYVIAMQLLLTLTMFAPVKIKDAKTEMDRMNDPYAATRDGVQGFYNLMKARVLAAYAVLQPSIALPVSAILVPMLGVGIAADPVTGS